MGAAAGDDYCPAGATERTGAGPAGVTSSHRRGGHDYAPTQPGSGEPAPDRSDPDMSDPLAHEDDAVPHQWAVTYLATVSKTVVVQARSPREAMDLADEAFEQPTLCYQCSSEMDISDWMPGESKFDLCDEGPVT